MMFCFYEYLFNKKFNLNPNEDDKRNFKLCYNEEMELDRNVFVIGEEVGYSGGPHDITKGLLEKYGEFRVIDTPISEMGFTGLAVGASYIGLKPIVDFMTWNFALQSIDHIINSCAKTLYMSGGRISCPIVFRGPNGFNLGYAAQHTQDFSNYYGCVPGLKVVAPYTAKDHKGLLKSAIRDKNPVIFLESEMLYDEEWDEVDSNYLQPLDKAIVERKGKDITIVGIGISLKEIFKASAILENDGIDCEIINLVSLRPLDISTIEKSVTKTNHLVLVDFSWPLYSVSSEIAASVHERCFSVLKKPIIRLNSKDIPCPYAENLESMTYPTSETIVYKIRSMLNK